MSENCILVLSDNLIFLCVLCDFVSSTTVEIWHKQLNKLKFIRPYPHTSITQLKKWNISVTVEALLFSVSVPPGLCISSHPFFAGTTTVRNLGFVILIYFSNPYKYIVVFWFSKSLYAVCHALNGHGQLATCVKLYVF